MLRRPGGKLASRRSCFSLADWLSPRNVGYNENVIVRLPVIPVPLRPPDDEILLSLEKAFTTIYDRAAYDLSIDYTAAPPPPALSQAERTWMSEQLSEFFE